MGAPASARAREWRALLPGLGLWIFARILVEQLRDSIRAGQRVYSQFCIQERLGGVAAPKGGRAARARRAGWAARRVLGQNVRSADFEISKLAGAVARAGATPAKNA